MSLFRLLGNYHVLDLTPATDRSPLPTAPSLGEKYTYVGRSVGFLILFSVLSLSCITLSTFQLYKDNAWLFPFFLLLAYTVVYFLISLRINFLTKDFDLWAHQDMVWNWQPRRYPTVDVFLPNCGEPVAVLRNTWDGVAAMARAYRGRVTVHCLDDAHRPAVRAMAADYGFVYHARPDRGWFKKAGNLRYGYRHSSSDFIAIFDADFRPRHDFLNELLPYLDRDPRLGIVQSPQYFAFDARQNWLERGAGAVQELFYRAIQVSRQAHGGAICVGSNAIYRRAALDDIGGTTLIEHSEDVHTGFDLRRKGWGLQYVPLVLAKGLCPSELNAFFKQQYRWCAGSMSLLSSAKFWRTRLPVMTRLCYFSGFMYYIHTAIYALFTPVIPLVMLLSLPDEIRLANYLLIFPSIVYMHLILPLWHRKPMGIEAASTRIVFGWAHLLAIWDKFTDHLQEWQPTGAAHGKDKNYRLFRAGVFAFNFVPAAVWVVAAAWYMATRSAADFAPIFFLGLYYFFSVLKVAAYREALPDSAPDARALYLSEAMRC